MNEMNMSPEEAHLVLQNLLSKNTITIENINDSLKIIRTQYKDSPKKKQTKKEKKKKPRKQYRMRHIALQLAYDGETHSGFTETMNLDYNKKIPPDNSIEKHLFHALQKSCLINVEEPKDSKDDNEKTVPSRAEQCHYSRAGRTDRGVSAYGQVIALHVRSAFPLDVTMMMNSNQKQELILPKNSCDCISIPINDESTKTMKELDYPYILNHLLPPTIRILGWCPVSSDFSARFSASGRHYKYFFIRRRFNLSAMQSGLQHIQGKHDFRNLCKINAKEVSNFERVIYDANIVHVSKEDNERQVCYMNIKGQAFLWHQIRCIAALHFFIGKELENPSLIPQLLDIHTNPCKPSYEMASDLPLVLHSCMYKNVRFGYTVQSLWNVTQLWESQWEDAMIRANKIQDWITSLRQDGKVKLRDVKDYYHSFVIKKKQGRRRKKRKFGNDTIPMDCDNENDSFTWLPESYRKCDDNTLLNWGDAMDILSPYLYESHHVPIMKRSKGTSYEEKLHAIMTTDKKREKYEVDVLQKRKTKADDKNFYDIMTRQGGSAWD